MSQAFVKEPDGAEVFADLPDRPVSQHPNYVTQEGLDGIEAALAAAREASNVAQSSGDRAALAESSRDLRYWTARRASAELQPPPADNAEVRFGSTVTVVRGDGREQTFKIVGEDEADPKQGTLSYVSPLARVLIGKRAGDTAMLGADAVDVRKIG